VTTWPARWRWSPGRPRGLGLLIATELAGRGCRLLLCARDDAELERAADRLRSANAEVAAVACDVTREVRRGSPSTSASAPRGYEIFRDKAEGCLKVVLQP